MSVIKRAIITEKSMRLVSQTNQYMFEVVPEVNKDEIAQAVAKRYGVKVEKVTTQIRAGKKKRVVGTRRFGRRPSYKIAYVRLSKGDKIQDFEEKLSVND